MLAHAPFLRANSLIHSASYPRSASSIDPAFRRDKSLPASRLSCASPGVTARRTGRPSTLLEPHPVDELGELIVGQVPAGRSAHYAADDPVIPSSPLAAGSAKTHTALRLLGVPERGVVGLVITGDRRKLTGKLAVLIHPFEKIGRRLVRGD